ncbi:MAG: c-type cytochrome [Tahibacter sp.]
MRLFASVVITAACWLPAAMQAQTRPEKPGQLGLCAACHGETGMSSQPGTPHLAGQDATYLIAALQAYRSGARDVAVMRAATGSLSAADVERLAQWYAWQSIRPAPTEP